MKTKFVGISALCVTLCSCVSNHNSTATTQKVAMNDTDLPTYSLSVKCASMAKSINDHRLMIGGQDLVKLEVLAYEKAKTLAESQQKSHEDLKNDFASEINKIDMQVEKNMHQLSRKSLLKVTIQMPKPLALATISTTLMW